MDDNLQFDRAEFAAPRSTTCTACQAPLVSEYFSANGQVLCAKCADNVRQFVVGSGSGADRFAMAFALGLGAALLGGAVYAAVMIGSSSQWGIISIAIGWLVGKAVRKGSNNRGGWRYQLLAAFLTYTAICGAYAADILHRSGDLNAAKIITVAIMSYAIPFLGGFQNILGILIIGFGVWQAWQMNRALNLEVTGPHALGGAAPAPRA